MYIIFLIFRIYNILNTYAVLLFIIFASKIVSGMKTTSIWFVLLIIFVYSSTPLKAVPAYPYPIKVTQPDGSELTIRLHGDEFFNYKTTEDGYALITDATGFLTYAQQDTNGNLITTNVKANEITKRTVSETETIKKLTRNISFVKQSLLKRTQRALVSASSTPKKVYPLIGTPKSLVILVNFSDKSFVTPTPLTAFTNLLNQSGYSTNGGTGSAKDYFHDSSMSVFTPEFDVVGPYTLPNPMAFYGGNDTSGEDKNPRQMVIDACTLASNAGIDFTQYDTDNDGIVDNIFIYYAGYNEAEGGPANTVWPHRWSLADNSTVFNGKIIFDYACTSELKGSSGSNMCGIGTFCHEFGHVLGLPDYYATNDATHHTLSTWNIMDYGPYLNGGRTPPAYSAYDRFFLNWLAPVELKKAANVTLDVLTTSNKAYLITQNGNHNLNGSNPSPVEFFTLENRQKTGWDTYLPGHGMLITHIFYNSSTWNANTVNNVATAMGVDIVEADGIALSETSNIDATDPGDPFPGTSNVTSYSPVLRSGVTINKPLTTITETNGIIKFKFMGGGNLPTLNSSGILSTFNTVQGTPSAVQTVSVSGIYLQSDINLSFKTNLHYQMKKKSDPETAWSKTISFTPVDSTVLASNIQIRYNPTVPSYADKHTETLMISSTNADSAFISMTGTSTRPVYVVAPVADEATDVSIAGFTANWNKVNDASGYYLTVYNLSDGVSSFNEGFNNGLTAPRNWTITATGISNSPTYSGDSVPSIEFKNPGEFIQTEQYVTPVTGLSFFIRSVNGQNGNLLIQAWNNVSWINVDSVAITNTLNTTKTYTYSADKNYTRFRLTNSKAIGYFMVDDVTVTFPQKLEFNAKDKWLTSNSDVLINLASNRDYFYKVEASDKTLNADNSVKYENITVFSNLITTKTLQDKSYTNTLIAVADSVYVDNMGTINLYIPSTRVTIYVYNVIGQMIRTINNPVSNKVEISGLPRHQIYIIRAGNRVSKVIL